MSSSERESDDKAEVVGYHFEPGFAEEEIVSQNDRCFFTRAQLNFNEGENSLYWCACENFTILPTFKEYLCCHLKIICRIISIWTQNAFLNILILIDTAHVFVPLSLSQLTLFIYSKIEKPKRKSPRALTKQVRKTNKNEQ